MATKIPLHYQYSSTDTVGLSEYQAGEQIAWSYIYVVSGQDIKTINNQSIVGSGNITIEGGTGGGSSGFEQTFLLMGA
jgi:hypothetical protein